MNEKIQIELLLIERYLFQLFAMVTDLNGIEIFLSICSFEFRNNDVRTGAFDVELCRNEMECSTV